MSERTKVVVNARTGEKRVVTLSQAEIARREAERVAWELAKNTKDSQESNGQILKAAKEEILEDLIVEKAREPSASETIKAAAGIIRSGK